MLAVPCTLERIDPVGPRYRVFTCRAPANAAFAYVAGQHVKVRFADDEGPMDRYYSIASAPRGDGTFELCVQLDADSRSGPLLRALDVGAVLDVAAPRGSFRVIDRARPLVFVAGGSGIAPMRAFLQELVDEPTLPPAGAGSPSSPLPSLVLVYGCRDAVEIPFFDDLRATAVRAAPRFALTVVAERGAREGVDRGTVTDALARHRAALAGAHVYLCGPSAMLAACVERVAGLGVAESAIFRENP